MIAGLTDAYVDFVTYIQQHDPLPPFETAKSRLQLKESTILLRATRESGSSSSTTSLVANSQNFDDDMNRQNSSQGIHNNNNNHRNRGNKNNKNLGGQNSGRGGRGSSDDGFSGGQGAGSGNRGQQQQWQTPWQWPWQQGAPWIVPPCPYPTYSWTKPNATQRPQQPGLLGSRPLQAAFNAITSSLIDIEAALHTLSLAQPNPSWYMDTGATSHMTSSQGNLSSYFNMSKNNGIIVGNGQSIPIRGFGRANLSPSHHSLVLKKCSSCPQLD